jgi:DNA-binding response OmpR family regulator
MRILIVDDRRDVADSLVFALDLMGHTALTAYSEGQAEQTIIAALGLDAYVIDWWLQPGRRGNGVGLLARVRAGGDMTPAAVITACDPEAFESAQLRCRELGRAVCLRKPFNPQELIDLLAGLQANPPGPCGEVDRVL